MPAGKGIYTAEANIVAVTREFTARVPQAHD
jgi:hypothetical protein